LHTFLHTMRRGCGIESEDEVEDVNIRQGLTPQQEAECDKVYLLVASLIDAEDGVIRKEDLVKAHDGERPPPKLRRGNPLGVTTVTD
jgi:hypothetical protein